MTKKRSQASVEYLVILAAVVIISLAVVGVLTGFPALTRGISTKESLAYWQSADIGIEKPYMSVSATDGTSTVVLRNNHNFNIVVTDITFGGSAVEYSGLPATLTPGQTKTVAFVARNPCTTLGNTYSINVAVVYQDASTGSAYTFSGTRPLIGTCQ
ncbi:MAG: hypothetical protein V1820_04775 [archaeon]